MSVTIGFVPFALLYGIGLGASALANACTTRSVVSREELLADAKCSDELHRLLYPNLNASRQTGQANRPAIRDHSTFDGLEQAERSECPCFVRKTFVQDPDFARKAIEALGGREEPVAVGNAFLLDGHAVLLLPSETESSAGGEPVRELWMVGNLNEDTVTALATAIEGEYKRTVRDYVHGALLQRSSEYGLQLESEEVQSDQSVVLTFTV